uniref:Uncharacterized protein n=1 Tax=viral metagenome TaxID=1070528 RepID=A0A6C0HY75_9ZZZZ
MEEQPTFFSHVFNFEQESRNEMVNIAQYTVFSIVFITLLNRGIQEYMPEVDKDKGSIAIFVEVVIQCLILFLGIVFIHRIITYFPSVSGAKYADQNVIAIILPTLILLLSTSTLGQKVGIIVDRLTGQAPVKKVTQSNPGLSILPKSQTVNPINSPEPDFNSMFAGPTTPLVNAASPESFEPMPSNFGGSIF